MYYKLDENKQTVPCDLAEWSNMVEDPEGRHVDWIEIDGHNISTVFLGLDYNYFGDRPLIFETMIFGKDGDAIYMTRASTWDEAKEQHEKAKEWLFKNIEKRGQDDEVD